jgi:ClpP class serine protease
MQYNSTNNIFIFCLLFLSYSKRTVTPTKKVTQDDLDKSKQDLEEIYMLFRNFVKTNRPQLDIDSVATGETWFGTDALERNLCDKIQTVDDVLVNHVLNGHNVYQIEYKPENNSVLDRFGQFLEPESSHSEDDTKNIFQKPIRWFIRIVADAINNEVYNTISNGIDTPIERRYMMKDNTANSIRTK